MRRLPAPLPPLAPTLALLLTPALLGASGCGATGPGSADATDATDDGIVVEVMIEDGRARPAGDRVEVPLGESVALVVMADSAGLIHVEADEAQQIEYEPGTTTFALDMERAGRVDVELHDPDQLLVQLEVR